MFTLDKCVIYDIITIGNIMEQYIIELFQDVSILTVTLLIAGVLLCVIEVFVPKFGLTGVLGVMLIGTGVSSYYLDGFKFKQIIGILLIISIILAVAIFIELWLEAKGIIKNPNKHELRTYKNTGEKLNYLIGATGKVVTNIDLGGTVEINGKLYYCVSDTPIMAGSSVQVIGVQNNALKVKAI